MINTQGKLLISAFIVIIIGLALIQPIADDTELVSTSSYPVPNETLSFANETADIVNETFTLSSTASSSVTLANNWLTAVTGLRNATSEDILGYCNVTLPIGNLTCNTTGNETAYADYTYVSALTETLTYDDLVSFDPLRNQTSEDINSYCNVTKVTGGIRCNKTYSNTGYADYVYESDTPYIRDSTTSNLVKLAVLFFAIGIFAVGIGFAWKAFKDSGTV